MVKKHGLIQCEALGVTIDSKSSSSSKVTPKILVVIAAAATVFLGKEVRICSAKC